VSLSARRLLAGAVSAAILFAAPAAPALADPVLDLEKLDGPTAVEMMEDGELTSVQLTRAYIARIDALNKRGPGLNAVTQLNSKALAEAAVLDKERAAGHIRGPAHGLPILLKDLIDVVGMYTSNGNHALRESFPPTDSGVAKKLKQSGVVILGKLGLSEYANSFGNQPSGFANLTGQVVHGFDADQNPSGSSSGSGTAGAAALSMLVIGTETSGSIIGPSNAQSLVGLRPTVGLVPGYGIGPISASQDTAGPMDRTVANAALTLQSIAGHDPINEAGQEAFWGADFDSPDPARNILPALPADVPDYLSALDLDFVEGMRIGYNGTTDQVLEAKAALEAAGAILVPRATLTVPPIPALPPGYEQHKSIDAYYARLGPFAPIRSLAEEVADNIANAHEALKFGHNSHLNALNNGLFTQANEDAYRTNLAIRKAAWHATIDAMFDNETPADPSDDFEVILGTVPQAPQAGYPQVAIPMGYNATHRRTVNVSIHGRPYTERTLIGAAYVIEQGTKKRKPASELNPSMYRCADTVPAPPYAERGGCNPDHDSLKSYVASAPKLDFSLETESVAGLGSRMAAGTLTAQGLTRAYLARIALTNAEGPSIQAVRDVAGPSILADAAKLDAERKQGKVRGPLHGIPVLLNDTIDAVGLPTTAGSIALQHSKPAKDAKLVAKLKAAGAIILGKTNVSELGGLLDDNAPHGYSSLGGQVMLPSDTDKTTAGSSAGAAASTAAGVAALTIGTETGTDAAQLIGPAGVAGVVGLKPTVGLVGRTGILPGAKSQDAPGPITRTVRDAAAVLQAIAGPDPDDDATAGAPAPPNYSAALSPSALSGKRVGVVAVAANVEVYPGAVSAIQGLGATTVLKTIGTPSPNPPSIVLREFERDLDGYLAKASGGAGTLAGIVAYNDANPVEGLKYQQGRLLAAQAVDLTDPATLASYEADRAGGKAGAKALIDALLADVDVMAVNSGNALVGIADRAGYPVLTVPAGFGTGGAGRNPIAITFVGAPFSEASLLAAGHAFEQATNVRLAPSWTNPSMWRCVPGSTFYSPHHCHPGDLAAG
jgi:amidase